MIVTSPPHMCFYFLLLSGTLPASFAIAYKAPVLTVPTVSSTPHNNIAADVAQDKRLEQTITLDACPITLADLLHKYSRADMPLTCTRSCAEQKLQIHLVKRPLSLLLRSLADMLPGTWTADKKTGGYVFRMSDEAVSKRSRWWEVFLRAREVAIQEQKDFVLQKMQTPLKPLPHVTTPEGYRNSEGFTAEQSAAMYARMMAVTDFYNALPADLQQQIASRLNLTRYYRVGSNTFSSPPGAGDATIRLNDLPEAIQRIVRQTAARFTLSDDALVSFVNQGFAISVYVMTPISALTLGGPSLFVGNAPQSFALMLNQQPLAEAVGRKGSNSSLDWKYLAACQNATTWKNSLPDGVNLHDLRGSLPRHRPEMLRRLTNVAGIEYVSDYYSIASQPYVADSNGKVYEGFAPTQPLTHTLPEELNHFAAEEDVSWKQQNGIYLFRDNRWYRNDLLEVPQSMLNKWLAKWQPVSPSNGDLASAAKKRDANTIKDEPPPKPSSNSSMQIHVGKDAFLPPSPEQMRRQMEWEVTFVSALTPWQFANGLAFYAHETDMAAKTTNIPRYRLWPFLDLVNCVLEAPALQEFYSGLNETQRDQLVHSQLPATSLTEAQQRQALSLLRGASMSAVSFSSGPVLLRLQRSTMGGGRIGPLEGRPDDVGTPKIVPLELALVPPAHDATFDGK